MPASAGAASYAGAPQKVEGLSVPARATATAVQLGLESGFADRFWPGVNLGATTPGYQPGEVSARAPEYRRWFKDMGQLGVRVIRVYSLLDPSFYSELRRYNLAHPKAPLYVIHGVWIPEDRFYATRNLWDPQVVSEQKQLVDWVHGAVFGKLKLKPRPGYASGTWKADISRWVIAWSPGIEWDPSAIQQSEAINPPRGWDGKYISTRGNSTSSEAWIAMVLDYMAGLDAKRGWSRAMTFTNWITADPLKHPYEPLELEDSISIDAMNMRATPAWPGGLFASYHAYPYYPDFLKLQPEYANAADPYGAYLRDLRAHYDGMAVMVTEFGVPSSLGEAHLGPLGRNQGGLSEREAGQMDAAMLDQINQAGYTGGVVFEWIDEWFKFTWNTIDFDLNRQLWLNDLTNEQHFGVMAAEPNRRKQKTIASSRGSVRSMKAAADYDGVSLTLSCKSAAACSSLRFGFDTRPGSNQGLPGLNGVGAKAETAVALDGKSLRLWQAAWTDPFPFLGGIKFRDIPVDPAQLQEGSGVWDPPRLLENHRLTVRATGEERPAEFRTYDPLPYGNPNADRRNLAYRTGRTLRLRVPWTWLGFADPSTRTLIDPKNDGTIGTKKLSAKTPLRIQVFDKSGSPLTSVALLTWRQWMTVKWHERRKAGWSTLKNSFAKNAR